jgi:GNAT superfamily N-acetyltransferase
MNATVRRVPLIVGQSGDVVAAELRDRIEDHNLLDWRTRWLPILASADHDAKKGERPPLFIPGGGVLDWPEWVEFQWRHPDYRASFAIECEGTTQGMVGVYRETGRTRSNKARGFIEIGFLESAPWNRAGLTENPRFHGIGRMLVVAAIAFSLSKGFDGRLRVLALNESTEFFAKCGMTDFGQDTKHPHLRLLEMTADQAKVFVATTFTRLHRLLSSRKSALEKLGRNWSAIDRWFE